MEPFLIRPNRKYTTELYEELYKACTNARPGRTQGKIAESAWQSAVGSSSKVAGAAWQSAG